MHNISLIEDVSSSRTLLGNWGSLPSVCLVKACCVLHICWSLTWGAVWPCVEWVVLWGGTECLWLQCHLLTAVAAGELECVVAEVRPGCAHGFPRTLGTAVSLSLVVVKEVFGNGLCPGWNWGVFTCVSPSCWCWGRWETSLGMQQLHYEKY